MKQPPDFAPGAEFIDAPRDPDLLALHKLWLAKRGNRQLPSRVDFDPSEFKNLLPDFFIYNVEPTEGSFVVRLIGERLRDFIGTMSGASQRDPLSRRKVQQRWSAFLT